jgi:formylglycine-generating enzyme required for sulfatase activity
VDQTLSKESEQKLRIAGEKLGLRPSDIDQAIAAELERTGAARIVEPPPPEPTPIASVPGAAGNAFDEFRRILKMSRLCLDGGEMSDDQRDAMCNLGESLGLTGGQAEDLIDEYLEAGESLPLAQVSKTMAAVPHRPAPAPVASKPVTTQKPAPAVGRPTLIPKKETEVLINISPAARAIERKRFPNFTNCAGVEMFLVPTGRFVMGSMEADAQQNEHPLTPVVLSCFYMARLPITNAQYEMFDPTHASKRAPWANEKHPVIYVSWNDAMAFCEWLSKRERKHYRLPTEAEWEFSARGDDGRIFPWGSWSSVGHFANLADARTNFPWRDPGIDDGFAETAPVGSFPRGASPFGIEDLAGNVFEWCFDSYEPYKGKEIANPRVATKDRQKIYRGGSWKSRMSSLRATARAFNDPRYFGNDIGFRVVCECGA